MPATLILADQTGRLGNRLILFSHVIAAAEEHGCRVLNLSILPAAHYFEGLHLNPLGRYPKRFFPIDLRWLFRAFALLEATWLFAKVLRLNMADLFHAKSVGMPFGSREGQTVAHAWPFRPVTNRRSTPRKHPNGHPRVAVCLVGYLVGCLVGYR